MTRLARSLGGAIVAAALAASSPLPGLAQARSAPTTLVGPCYPPGTELTVDGPSPRRGMAMANDAAHKQVVLFGGWDGVINLSDTWTWDGTTWTEQHPAHSPSPRRSLGMAYDAFRRQVVLFGGYDGSGDRDDTWIWDGEDWTEQHPAHTPPSNSIFGMAFDAGTRTIVMNGGSAFVFYTTWLWDGSDWLTGHTRAPRWRQRARRLGRDEMDASEAHQTPDVSCWLGDGVRRRSGPGDPVRWSGLWSPR